MQTSSRLRQIIINIDDCGPVPAIVVDRRIARIDRHLVCTYRVHTADDRYAADHRVNDALWVTSADIVGEGSSPRA